MRTAFAPCACPDCLGSLVSIDGRLLRCEACGVSWPVRAGLPRLYREEQVRGTDRLMRVIYDRLPSWHDPLTAALAPILQGVTERQGRDRYMPRVELGSLRARGDRPVRVLDVGIGAGANLPFIYRDLPPGLPVEVWGLDLSEGMLRECRKLMAREGHEDVRLLMADAHALPFPDGSFDRVLHVGGIGGYRDPRRALAEMARVAVRGTPIVVVDEQLDPGRRHSLVHRAAFRAITFYDSDPHCPKELVPPGATDVVEEQISRYYYCLTFRWPASPG